MGRVVVVGAGIAGLAAAYELAAADVDVVVVEAVSRAGGSIRSVRVDGWLCEDGPIGFLDDAAMIALCRRLSLVERLQHARREGTARFVVRRGRLRRIPSGPLAFVGSDLLSLRGRLRVLAEPLVPRRRHGDDESVEDLARRRLGRAAAEILVDAAVTGVWGGDPRTLSARSAFPTLAGWERDHGGILRGLASARGVRGRLASFPSGMEELPAALASALGPRLRLQTPVAAVVPRGSGGFDVRLAAETSIGADAVILACPSWSAAKLVAPLDDVIAEAMAAIPWVSIAVVHLGLPAAAAAGLRGLGFLVPRGEGASTLGVLLPSNIFPSRAPEGFALATVMVGGARDPAAVRRSDEELIAGARDTLRALAGVAAAPAFARVARHERAIPQYTIGHADRIAAIDAALARRPGLFVTGSAYRGISVGACVADGARVAALAASAASG